jgi:hypothetical protein
LTGLVSILLRLGVGGKPDGHSNVQLGWPFLLFLDAGLEGVVGRLAVPRAVRPGGGAFAPPPNRRREISGRADHSSSVRSANGPAVPATPFGPVVVPRDRTQGSVARVGAGGSARICLSALRRLTVGHPTSENRTRSRRLEVLHPYTEPPSGLHCLVSRPVLPKHGEQRRRKCQFQSCQVT